MYLELRPGLVLELWVGEPLPVALDEGVVGDPAPVGQHQLPHTLQAELLGLVHGVVLLLASTI